MNKQRNEIGNLIDVALEVFETSGNLLIQLKNLATVISAILKSLDRCANAVQYTQLIK